MRCAKNERGKYENALEYEIFVKGEYGFAKERIQSAKSIFDIGGHIGLFSKRCRTLNSNAKIYYFEPIIEFYDKAKSINLNDKNIILNNLGIGSKSGSGIILLNGEKTMQSSKYASFLNKNGKKVKCEFVTLKEYLQENDVEEIDVLKMDIEGMEFEVLSSWGAFEWNKICNIIVEVHLLNENMRLKRDELFYAIRSIFSTVCIMEGRYCKEIFMVWACKNGFGLR